MSKLNGLLIGALALATCPMLATAGDFPTGVYASKGVPATIHFASGGRVRVVKSGALKVDGSYAIDRDQIQLSDKNGPWACTKPGEETGTYHWKADKDQLTFTKIADTCADRVQSLTQYTWKRR